ncbi:unnamed protein product [Cylicostephanus goldi]|uniref:Uncharacterized protein n=1 Tax=Cylicostephanus goldi TaxID=71465 RepID=A0A3P7NM39_CYLGO|nr:unnamed protein product [Cylicostephanus goldi]
MRKDQVEDTLQEEVMTEEEARLEEVRPEEVPEEVHLQDVTAQPFQAMEEVQGEGRWEEVAAQRSPIGEEVLEKVQWQEDVVQPLDMEEVLAAFPEEGVGVLDEEGLEVPEVVDAEWLEEVPGGCFLEEEVEVSMIEEACRERVLEEG